MERCSLRGVLQAAYNLGESRLGIRFESKNQDLTPPTESGGSSELILTAGNYINNPFSCYAGDLVNGCISFYSKEQGVSQAPILWVSYAVFP